MQELTNIQLKTTMVNTMVKIHRVCEEHGIKYYLHAGTLLGAVRHKGFIPWDDDIDIVMLREDYNKFIEVTHSIDCGFDFYCCEKDKEYNYPFGKVCDRSTLLIETNHKNIDLGVYIDVFPLDVCPDDFNGAIKFVAKCHNYSILFSNASSKRLKKSITPGWKRILKPVAYVYAKIRGSKHYIKKLVAFSQKYAGDLNSKYIANCLSPNYIEVFERDWFNDRVVLDFEGEKFYAPKEWDKILTCMYKNYMELPPKEKQVTHHDFVAYVKA